MENRRNFYRLLQVQPDAAPDVIKASYRALMQKLRLHPDLGGDDRDAALVNQAYAVLSDPVKRAHYDRERMADQRRTGPEARAPEREPVVPARPTTARHATPYPSTRTVACPFCAAPNQVAEGPALAPRCRQCDSPLTPATRSTAANDRQRAARRFSRDAPIRVFVPAQPQRAIAGRVHDLSTHGMRFECSSELAAGGVVKLESADFCAVARVVSCAATGAGRAVGVEFLTLEFRRPDGTFVAERV